MVYPYHPANPPLDRKANRWPFHNRYIIRFFPTVRAFPHYVKQEAENERLRTEIMLSQIQPHFLYNTLGAIGYLCRDNPEAKAAVNKFARYLQGNMASLLQTEPIPFATELEHTKAYLELEQLRFREKLNVVYDLEATDFLLPTLTLQPIVENTVFHGVRGNADGRGIVTVSSREYSDRYEITVADDGPGFDPDAAPPDDAKHTLVCKMCARSCGESAERCASTARPDRTAA